MNTLHIWTQDKLRLQGVHYQSQSKDTCVLFIHGMAGNFVENYFATTLGQTIQEGGYSYIYTHNRGYSLINDITFDEVDDKNTYKLKRIGAVYERFEESILDIDAWYNEALRLGYQKIILVGHSLGCNKVIHYIHRKKPAKVVGLILLSPPDMVANGKESGNSKVYGNQLKEARDNVNNGSPRKLLSDILWNWCYLSSQTFIDLFEDGCPADNLPIMRNPDRFIELESIMVHTLSIMGEFDDIVVRTLEDDMNLIEKKAVHVPSFTKVFIPGANHVYDNREKELAHEVLVWLKIFKHKAL